MDKACHLRRRLPRRSPPLEPRVLVSTDKLDGGGVGAEQDYGTEDDADCVSGEAWLKATAMVQADKNDGSRHTTRLPVQGSQRGTRGYAGCLA